MARYGGCVLNPLDVLTPAEVAKILKAHEPQVLDLIITGQLGALELAPGDYRVTATDLRRFINVRRADFRPPATLECQQWR